MLEENALAQIISVELLNVLSSIICSADGAGVGGGEGGGGGGDGGGEGGGGVYYWVFEDEQGSRVQYLFL